ncbi:hypothetical protein HNR47_000528 [Methylopila jiangsuensis]|nr:hypothetical protein [Methylopila jiangsuensis]
MKRDGRGHWGDDEPDPRWPGWRAVLLASAALGFGLALAWPAMWAG